jgi:hypothetical protein
MDRNDQTKASYEVGRKLVDLCRKGQYLEAINSLYSPDIVNLEARNDPAMPARTQGIDAVRKKNQWWMDNHTIHSAQIEGPYPNGDRFIVHFSYDTTAKAGPMAGKRMKFEEAGLYTVRSGKITQEEFFYHFG